MLKLIYLFAVEIFKNPGDLDSLAVPNKYQSMNTFYKYYNSEYSAPVLTIFIGGNHEASNHLQELFYGGWVAPNIYYLGAAGVINYGGIRIAGISGIYKHYNYFKGHYEKPPFDDTSIRSIYHIREIEVFRLLQIENPIDIFLSHDWPQGITKHGDQQKLLNMKKFLDVDERNFGNPATAKLLRILQPAYWFAAHMHVKFPAIVKHDDLGKTTKFLALSKVHPFFDFLQVVDVPHTEDPPVLKYDAEWLSIVAMTQHLFSTSPDEKRMPTIHSAERYDFRVTPEQIEKVKEILGEKGFEIPTDFCRTAVPYYPGFESKQKVSHSDEKNSYFLDVLEKIKVVKDMPAKSNSVPKEPTNPEEIQLDFEDENENPTKIQKTEEVKPSVSNPEEIPLDFD